MDIQFPNTKIVVLEGVPGAGKNTVQEHIMEHFKDKLIYLFNEEDLLFSWKHGWIPNIDEMRLSLYENFLTYCEQVTTENDDALFIVNRFHISYKLFTKLADGESQERYNNILNRLKSLLAFVVVPMLPDEHIETRASHVERVDPIWQNHLNKRLEQKGFKTLYDMYSAEQVIIKGILEEQKIPFTLINVEVNHGK